MTGPDLVLGADPGELAMTAARAFAELARAATAARGRFLVALAGGSTPRRVYEALARERLGIDWGRVEVFWSDERCVPPDHPDSNYRMARTALLDHVPIPATQVHRIMGELEPERAATLQEEAMARVAGSPPTFDLVLLGMGQDGHTASLFAESAALIESVRTAVAVIAPKPPPRRVTFTLVPINRAREVWVLVTGADKAATVAAVFQRPGPGRYPIEQVAPPHGRVRWFLDQAAAGGLTPRNPL